MLLAAALVLGWKALPGRTPALTGPDPIAVLEPVQIGGMTQWLLIRGKDRSAPVLLWPHGGSPGAAQMPLAHATTRALECDFVVVHWGQRGAGKSSPSDFDPANMTLEQFVQDAHAVTRHLQARLGTDRLLVLGYSWGAMLGARLVVLWPKDYAGYIGVGQQVSTARGVNVTLDRLGPLIRAERRGEHLRWLEDATPAALLEHAAYVGMMQKLDTYGGGHECAGLAAGGHVDPRTGILSG